MTFGDIVWLGLLGFFAYRMIKNGGCCGGHNHGSHSENSQGKHGHTGHNKQGTEHQHHMHEIGSNVVSGKDPVCGMSVQNNSPTSEFMGKTFHFCSEQCRKIFNLNPNKYIPHT